MVSVSGCVGDDKNWDILVAYVVHFLGDINLDSPLRADSR